MLESFLHEANSFVTLTLEDEYLALGGDSVSVRETQLFHKRLRELVRPAQYRHFTVGEYGELTGRPHYHVALFGVRSEHPDGVRGRCGCCICRAWRYGDVHAYQLSRFLAQYLAGYVVDKVYAAGPYSRLDGRTKEFQRMSNGGRQKTGGIGAPAMRVIADSVVDKETGEIRLVDGDVHSVFRMDRKLWPMGRYLRQQLRNRLQLGQGETKEGAEARRLLELLEFPTWQSREAKEEKREQGARKAYARDQIARSRKRI